MVEALRMAGGLTEEAAPAAVNQAAVLADGQQITVPTAEEAARTAEDPQEKKININTASAAELMTLPGIGETRAQDILAFREKNGAFSKAEDLMQVPGIKEGTYNKLKDRIRTQ